MSAIWPSAVASNSNLFVAVDFPNSVTALNGAINSTDTVITVSSAVNYPTSGGYVLIDSELILYTGISGNQLTGCSRGQNGTVATAHLNNAVVNLVVMAEHHNVLKDEIIALETSLNLPTDKALISNSSGRVDVSSTTDTELGFVHGVTSAIQTQLNSKIDTAGTGLTKIGTTLSLTSPVSTANGGTGTISYTNGQLLIGNSTGNTLSVSTLTGTANQVFVTNGAGSITLSTPQDINITSSPSFQQLTVGSTSLGGIVFNDTEVSPKTVTFEAPTTLTNSYVVHWPLDQGAASTFLQNDGAGNLTWASGGGSGVTSITGTIHQIIASASTGAVTLSTPQDIDTTSSPTFNALTLTNPLTVGNGGTGLGTLTAHDVLIGNGTSSITLVSPSTANLALVSNGTSSDPSFQAIVNSITGTTNQVIASSSTGAVTLSLPQSIATSSTPTFAGESITTSGTNASISFTNGSKSFGVGVYNPTGDIVIGSTDLISNQPFRWTNLGPGSLTLGGNTGTVNISPSNSISLFANTTQNSGTNFVLGSNTAKIVFTDSGINNVSVAAPSAITSSYTLKLPTAQGSSGSVMQNDGSGNLSWGFGTLASVASTGQTSSISTTTLFTPSATGTYRISVYIVDTVGTVFTLQGTIGWTDAAQAQTATTSTLTNTTNGYTQSSFFIEATSGNAVTYAVALTGTATYNAYVVAERLS